MGQVYGKKIGKVLAVVDSNTGKAESLKSYVTKQQKASHGAGNTKEGR